MCSVLHIFFRNDEVGNYLQIIKNGSNSFKNIKHSRQSPKNDVMPKYLNQCFFCCAKMQTITQNVHTRVKTKYLQEKKSLQNHYFRRGRPGILRNK